MLGPGRSVIYKREGYAVIRMTKYGDVLIRNYETDTEIWVDYYDIEFTDPWDNPGALLDALSTLGQKEEPPSFDDQTGGHVIPEEGPP